MEQKKKNPTNEENISSEEERPFETVSLELDNGEPCECEVITTLSVGEREYIALLPVEGYKAGSGEVFLYRFLTDGKNEPELGMIEDDEEYEAVSDAFDEFLDSAEFDELMTENGEPPCEE